MVCRWPGQRWPARASADKVCRIHALFVQPNTAFIIREHCVTRPVVLVARHVCRDFLDIVVLPLGYHEAREGTPI